VPSPSELHEPESMEAVIDRLEKTIERLEAKLLPPVPQSKRIRAAELGLRVLQEGDDA